MSINQLVENLLGFGNKLNNDPGLKQGAAFNSMQKQIIDRTLPALPLMEETTMPGLGSIVESLSNQESAESPLKNVDKREFKALQKLETEFNQKLTQYVAAYKAQLEHITSEGANRDNKENKNLAAQVQRLNNELLDISNRMWTRIQKLHTTDVKLQKALIEKRSVLRKQMQQLQGRRQHHEQVRTSGSTLEGEIDDNNLQVNSLYLQYLVWFFAASTLAVVAFHQVTKKS